MSESGPDSAAYRVREWIDDRITVLDPEDVREVYVAAERAARDLDNARGELRAVHAEKHRYMVERDQARAEAERLHSKSLPSITEGISDAEAEASATFDLTIDEIRTLKAERDWLRDENALLRVEVANATPDHQALADDAIAAHEENQQLQNLLGSIWLYVGWRSATRGLTTEQQEMWANVVDAFVGPGMVSPGETPRPVAVRWWREDFVDGSGG